MLTVRDAMSEVLDRMTIADMIATGKGGKISLSATRGKSSAS
jgi:DNA-binding IscR family transcriptional regulator